MLFAAGNFADAGFEASVFGFDIKVSEYGNTKKSSYEPFNNAIKKEGSLKATLEGADIAVLPLPYSRDGERISAPFSESPVLLSEVLASLSEKTLLLGGKLGADFPAKAIDYYEREDFAVLNAVPTAEGAIKIALEETKLSICGMKTAVLGFGRIGKILAKTLVSLGADVTVFARKAEARAWAKAFSCKAKSFDILCSEIGDFECIFNTVPHKIIFAEDLAQMKKGAVIIELASPPGGTEASEASSLGVRLVSAQSLPGKITPKSAGKIIYETIKEIITEEL